MKQSLNLFFPKFFFTTVIAILLQSCASEKQIPSVVDVQSVEKRSNATQNALVYTLPTTILRVEVEAEKVISKVGPFYRYSQKMLNVQNVIMEDKAEWVLKGIRIYTLGQPDESKRFFISSTGPNIAPFLNLTQEGVLKGINLEADSEIESGLKVEQKHDVPELGDVTFDAVPMLEKQLTKTSTASMAEETAAFIYKVRKRRFKMLASDYPVLPPDGRSFEIAVEELNQLESDFVELFVGKQERFKVSKTFDFIPDSMSVNNDVLCRFSKQEGILPPMNLSGTPIYIEVKVDDARKWPSAPVIATDKEPLRNGLYYCQPAKASVKVIDKNILLLEQEVFLGQYGQLFSLPASVLEQGNVSIELDAKTGALKRITRD